MFILLQEEKNGQKATEAIRMDIFGQIPPIEKMDATLSTLTKCECVSVVLYFTIFLNMSYM